MSIPIPNAITDLVDAINQGIDDDATEPRGSSMNLGTWIVSNLTTERGRGFVTANATLHRAGNGWGGWRNPLAGQVLTRLSIPVDPDNPPAPGTRFSLLSFSAEPAATAERADGMPDGWSWPKFLMDLDEAVEEAAKSSCSSSYARRFRDLSTEAREARLEEKERRARQVATGDTTEATP